MTLRVKKSLPVDINRIVWFRLDIDIPPLALRLTIRNHLIVLNLWLFLLDFEPRQRSSSPQFSPPRTPRHPRLPKRLLPLLKLNLRFLVRS